MKKESPGPGAAVTAHRPSIAGRGAARLHLIARDPHCLFATWRLGPAARARLDRPRGGAGSARGRLALRVYDVSPVPSSSRRPLQFFVGTRKSFYIPVPGAGRRYRAELGWAVGAAFIPLARSRAVGTPPSAPAGVSRKGSPSLTDLHPAPMRPMPSSHTIPAGPRGTAPR